MSKPLQQTIEALAKEKGIEPDVVISAIEEAVATASRKYYKTGENLKTRFNTETGQVDLFALKTVVQDVTNAATEIAIDEAREIYRQLYGDDVANSIELGDEMEFPKPTEVLGRIAAQTAKQVIFQKVREAERENIFAEYNQRIGDVVNGTIKRFENGDIILEVGRIEAALPRKEQSRAESYSPGDRVRTVIKGVHRSAKGPQNVLLAAKLTGWRIDIKSEEEKRREVEAQFEDLESGQEEGAAESAPASEELGAASGEGAETVNEADAQSESDNVAALPYELAG